MTDRRRSRRRTWRGVGRLGGIHRSPGPRHQDRRSRVEAFSTGGRVHPSRDAGERPRRHAGRRRRGRTERLRPQLKRDLEAGSHRRRGSQKPKSSAVALDGNILVTFQGQPYNDDAVRVVRFGSDGNSMRGLFTSPRGSPAGSDGWTGQGMAPDGVTSREEGRGLKDIQRLDMGRNIVRMGPTSPMEVTMRGPTPLGVRVGSCDLSLVGSAAQHRLRANAVPLYRKTL
jgi:hypothetical protein